MVQAIEEKSAEEIQELKVLLEDAEGTIQIQGKEISYLKNKINDLKQEIGDLKVQNEEQVMIVQGDALQVRQKADKAEQDVKVLTDKYTLLEAQINQLWQANVPAVPMNFPVVDTNNSESIVTTSTGQSVNPTNPVVNRTISLVPAATPVGRQAVEDNNDYPSPRLTANNAQGFFASQQKSGSISSSSASPHSLSREVREGKK
jgi:hypothetical protein